MATRQSTPKLKTPLTHSVNNTVASSIETHALATPLTNQETNNFREEITTELITPIIEQEASTLRQALVSSSFAAPMLLPSVNGTYADPYDPDSIRFINNKCVYTCTGLCCAFDNALASYQTQLLLSPVNINGTLATTVEQALHMINTARTQVNVDWNASSGVSAICNKPVLASVATLGTYNSLIDKPDFADVAYSGCYCDLCGLPTIPAAQVNSDWLATEGVALICNKPTLSCVACSGDYNDLCNKPDLCLIQQQSDWNQANSNYPTYIKNKPELARVATSGLYADLLGAPSIPEQVNADWLALSGPAFICNKPSLSEVALSGDYNDLRNIPPDTSKTYTFSFDESTHKLAVTEHGLFGDTLIFNDTIDTAYSFTYEDNTLTITDNRNNTYTVSLGTDFYTKGEVDSLICAITDLIPEQASPTNQLADKNFVNSSIATNTANFIGTFNNLACLCATVATPNDYAFYVHCDTCGNCVYDRYKYNASCVWVCEYTLNNSSFTAAQWAAINSGITDTAVAKITDVYNCTIKLCNADGTTLLGSFTLNQNQNTCICLDIGGGTVTGINVYCGSTCVCTVDDSTALCLSSNAFNTYAQISTTTYPGACCTGTLVPSDLNGYATCSWVTGKGYTTCKGTVTKVTLGSSVCSPDTSGNITLPAYPPDLSSCAGLDCTGTLVPSDLNGYATESWVTNKNYCTHDCLVKYEAVTSNYDRNILMMACDGAANSICPVYFNNVSGKKFTYNACCGLLKIGPIVGCTSSAAGKAGAVIGLGYMELSACTPYIYFHRNNACQDYSSRIIDSTNGLCITVNNATGCTAPNTSCTFCFLPTGVFKSPYDICSPNIRATSAIEALNFYNMTQVHGTQPSEAACCPNITFVLRCRYNSDSIGFQTWSTCERCVIMCGSDGGLYATHKGCSCLNWHGIVTCQCNYSLTANTIYYIKVGRLLDGFMTGTTELDIMASGAYLVDKVNLKWLGGCANDAANVNGIEINATNDTSSKGILGIGWIKTGNNWNCANDIYIKVCAPSTATYCFGLNRTLLGCAGAAWTTGFSCTTTAPTFTCFVCTKPNGAKAFHWTSGILCVDTICSADGKLTTCTGTVTCIAVGTTRYGQTSGLVSLPAYPPDLSSCAGLDCTGNVSQSDIANFITDIGVKVYCGTTCKCTLCKASSLCLGSNAFNSTAFTTCIGDVVQADIADFITMSDVDACGYTTCTGTVKIANTAANTNVPIVLCTGSKTVGISTGCSLTFNPYTGTLNMDISDIFNLSANTINQYAHGSIAINEGTTQQSNFVYIGTIKATCFPHTFCIYYDDFYNGTYKYGIELLCLTVYGYQDSSYTITLHTKATQFTNNSASYGIHGVSICTHINDNYYELCVKTVTNTISSLHVRHNLPQNMWCDYEDQAGFYLYCILASMHTIQDIGYTLDICTKRACNKIYDTYENKCNCTLVCIPNLHINCINITCALTTTHDISAYAMCSRRFYTAYTCNILSAGLVCFWYCASAESQYQSSGGTWSLLCAFTRNNTAHFYICSACFITDNAYVCGYICAKNYIATGPNFLFCFADGIIQDVSYNIVRNCCAGSLYFKYICSTGGKICFYFTPYPRCVASICCPLIHIWTTFYSNKCIV